jgi:hypothetical protein
MIGLLPKSLTVDGVPREIRSDFRVALTILEAYEDPDLTEFDKARVLLELLYVEPQTSDEAAQKAVWFLDGGDVPHAKTSVRVMDWQQDEHLIFPAINKVAGCEVRALEYCHWWTFLGWFYGIGEGAFSTVVSIRHKQKRGKPLEKWERDYIRDNPDAVKLKTRYSAAEEEEIAQLKSLFD